MENGAVQAASQPPWEELETGARPWNEFTPGQQERIVRHYAPKIRFLALRLKGRLPKSIELTELISAGTLGLMEALGKFLPQMGIRFETYAENRIRGAMLDELRRMDWFPRSLRQRVRVVDEAQRELEHVLGRMPSEEELAKRTGLGAHEVRQAQEALQNQFWVSLDSVQDTVSCDPDGSGEPYSVTSRKELTARVHPLVDTLTQREKLVLSLYYTEELNMRETAEVMGITEGRVSQLHTQALLRLRRNFLARYGDSAEF